MSDDTLGGISAGEQRSIDRPFRRQRIIVYIPVRSVIVDTQTEFSALNRAVTPKRNRNKRVKVQEPLPNRLIKQQQEVDS